MRQSLNSHEQVYYSTPVADLSIFVFVCILDTENSYNRVATQTMVCLSGKSHGKNCAFYSYSKVSYHTLSLVILEGTARYAGFTFSS